MLISRPQRHSTRSRSWCLHIRVFTTTSLLCADSREHRVTGVKTQQVEEKLLLSISLQIDKFAIGSLPYGIMTSKRLSNQLEIMEQSCVSVINIAASIVNSQRWHNCPAT